MKTIATEKLTLSYLRKLRWQTYLAAAVSALVILSSLLWMAFRLGGDKTTTLFSDTMYAAVALAGSACALITSFRARYSSVRLESRFQFAWLLIGLGTLLDGLGGTYYAYLEHLGQQNPSPSYADIGFILDYPLIFAGLLLMPTAARLERFRVRIALDASITALCALGISWFFFIGPAYMATKNQGPLLDIAVPLSYPFLDMLLILAIILLVLRPAERVLRPSLILIGVGVLSGIWADTGYAYFTAIGTYNTGTLFIDPFWFANFLLVGLAALSQYSALARKAYNERIYPARSTERNSSIPPNYHERQPQHALFIQSFLVYIPFTILLILTIYSESIRDQDRALFLVILAAIIGILVIVRYLLTGYENDILFQEREQRRNEAERLRILTAQLAEILELGPLLDRITALATSVHTFDTALLTIEEYPQQANAPGCLAVYAAASAVEKIVNWRFYGSRLAYCPLLQGREMEIIWAQQDVGIPSEVATWQKDQRVQATIFIPLTYQGKTLGSLGFSSRTTQNFGPHDRYIARTFAEQAATALEHAYLYQATREHEAFSRALANIATRLNMAVVEPLEIQQVICTEGANALRADYALLYIPDNNGNLLPTAISTSAQEPLTELSDWPCIYEHEYEAQVLASLQPALMQLEHPYSLGTLTAAPTLPTLTYQAYAVSRRQRIRKALSLREVLTQRFVPTAILAPLVARNAPAGLLVLARSIRPGIRDKNTFATSDLPQAQDFAEQAAVAFTNAQLYQQLSTAHQQLQELDQLKDQFIITASHELRTPLTAVQGFLELIAQYDETLPPQQRGEFLHKARRSCDELVLLLNNVMDVSRLEIDAGIRPTHIESVSVDDMVRGVAELIEPQLTQEKREIYVHIPSHLAVQADPVRLRQILLNLSMNALKYSPPGSPIAFSAHTITNRVPAVVISVVDKGKGITPRDQAHLFQRFVRLEHDLNSPVRGSGLGLYISRRLVEAMKGKIWVESSGIPGAGSVFNVQLPRAS